MTVFRMRLVEQMVEEDYGDFTVEAETPEQAAAVLIRAHDAAREDCRNLVVLPDGQAHDIDPRDVVATRVFCIQIDEAGYEVGGEIKPGDTPSPDSTGRPHQPGAGASEPAPGTEPWP